MIAALVPWIADALALLGLVVLTISLYGILRLPETTLRLHAASKTGLLGIVPLLLASALSGDASGWSRAVLIGAFLILTTPVVAHEIGRAAYFEEHHPGETPDTPTDHPH